LADCTTVKFRQLNPLLLISNPGDCTQYNLVYPWFEPAPTRQIEPHLSSDEPERRYRQAQNVIERSHYQTIWLLALGKTTQEVAEVRLWTELIYELVRSYNRSGPGMLGDHRHHNLWGILMMQQAQLWQALQESLPMVVCGPKVAAWMSELRRPVSAQRWEYLVALSLTQSATSMGKLIYRSSVEKKLAQQTARVQAEHPADVEVWTMDEHRLGSSRCWMFPEGNNRLLR